MTQTAVESGTATAFGGPMLAEWYENVGAEAVAGRPFVQPKLNGVRMIWTGEKCISRPGNPWTMPEGMVAELRRIAPGVILDGELYSHGLPLGRIAGAARRKRAADPAKQILEFHVFDLVVPDRSFAERSAALRSIVPAGLRWIRLVDTRQVDRADLEDWKARYEAQGYEGMMIRNPNARYIHGRTIALLKWKQWLHLIGRIVGVAEGKNRNGGRLGALLVAGDGWKCSLGAGLTDTDRDRIWRDPQRFIGREIHVRCQEITAGGSLFIPLLDAPIDG